ncbi:MAG: cation:proton antiporter [Rhizobiales bacterium]|nr:cation:proton antiporter [Hyphomicrobiales bacterium]MBO6697461.1 cation:proton antiporter [Hyphomicrobiales bacterium]MBO6736284.1 cation:proton antiporter [Hyphomicrobiales bacterium]MBO6912754.1 cation:proton antiporter [Hyphomicrobiales bacterium]MBO6953923.1 cation:proton antiporter [Hyphomicrobiales bacterium]
MDFVPFSLDPRDIVYMVAGLAFLGLTFQPGLSQFRLANIPFFYVLIGAALAFAGIPAIDPNAGGLSAKVVEHAAELIVIISLAGAGLAIDTRESWKNWNPTFRLLLISMPLTIVAVFLLGHWVVGLDWPSAMLLAAALAPTDPVLARSVQVGPPGRKEKPMEVALTAEAGLNDGLAFPFVYLAIAAATFAYAGDGFPQWIWGWFGYDLLYRVIAGWCIGHAIGHVISKVIYSRFGDASHGGWNAMLVVLAATLISYGITETFDAYGFLAVFAAARAGRANSRGTEKSRYEKYVHHGADQLESILLALMLLWFGMFIASGGLAGLTWVEVALALVILLFVRPASGFLSLLGTHCEDLQRFKVAFFGIRGMGTVFYIAYGQNHADFTQMETIWRVAAITILLSIIMHGFAAKFVLPAEEEDEPDHPYRAEDPDYRTRSK